MIDATVMLTFLNFVGLSPDGYPPAKPRMFGRNSIVTTAWLAGACASSSHLIASSTQWS